MTDEHFAFSNATGSLSRLTKVHTDGSQIFVKQIFVPWLYDWCWCSRWSGAAKRDKTASLSHLLLLVLLKKMDFQQKILSSFLRKGFIKLKAVHPTLPESPLGDPSNLVSSFQTLLVSGHLKLQKDFVTFHSKLQQCPNPKASNQNLLLWSAARLLWLCGFT